ncbi:MAG TPA: 3-hydroxyacyl-CoA dehydrogenase NAD-binding domain-containing protein, partial [Faecalibacter sp.]
LIIEAVFEDPQLKAIVTKESEPMIKSDGFFASNTSTLPISRLAEASVNPEKFIGIHFFSPVDKMPLVEIIVGKQTSDETLAHAIDYVTQIGKVPIVVNDSHGFFTSRVFGFYNFEAAAMVLEGINPQTIENVAKQAGMAIGPLAVMDEVSIELILRVIAQKESLNDNEKQLKDFFQKMADAGRLGKKVGKGFYDYPEGGKKTLWKNEFVEVKAEQTVSNEDIAKRLMHAMALDSYRCLEEGVLNTTLDGDIGSMLGLGFAPHTGGVFSYIDMVGIQQFVADCDRFLPNGNQWEVPQSLRDLAAQNFKFYTGNTQNWTKK